MFVVPSVSVTIISNTELLNSSAGSVSRILQYATAMNIAYGMGCRLK